MQTMKYGCDMCWPLPFSPPAYGFGTVMVVILSLLSLLGVFIVPLTKHARFSRIYEYVNLFLVALGTSALFSDAILHLIPGVSSIASLITHSLHTASNETYCLYITL